MTPQQLAYCIAQGEGSRLEFKQRVPAPTRVAKEVVAFANTHGGQLLIGVEDDAKVTGVKDATEEEYALLQAIEQCTDPPVALETARVRISRKRDVILVNVRESTQKPHFVRDPATDRRIAYIRLEDKSVEASREARRLMRQRPDRDILIRIGEKEHILLRHLACHERITVRQFSRLAGIPRAMASQTLVHLTRARMLCHHPDLREDYFTHGKELLAA